jgi:CheY-like chemotaxis protein
MLAETTGTVLIVDDEPVIRRMLEATLQSAGYRVIQATDGLQALEMMKYLSADLVVTDLVMPVQEGIETIRLLRRDFPRVKILAITGGLIGGLLSMARALGADAALPKPIQPDEFLAVVRKLLS